VGLGKVLEKLVGRFRKAETIETGKEAVPALTPKKVYLKAFPLRNLEDVVTIKREVELGNILIVKISPLASKSIEDVKQAVGELFDFTQTIGGDIARLGEERVVICPPSVRIWRGTRFEAKTLVKGA